MAQDLLIYYKVLPQNKLPMRRLLFSPFEKIEDFLNTGMMLLHKG